MHCCDTMLRELAWSCDQHEDPYDCPDFVICYCDYFDEYGIVVHDGGTGSLTIHFCPWCGTKLPDSKRDLWFDALGKLGYDDPGEQEIPEEFRSDRWYRSPSGEAVDR